MNISSGISDDVQNALKSIYEEIMWLAERPNVTPSRARAWYTHIMAESVKRQIRQFTGMVSQSAVLENSGSLRLEHYQRIQTTLTALVQRHKQQKSVDPNEFICTVIEHERVNIVTLKENYDALKAGGDYTKAGIDLVAWNQIPEQRRMVLWRQMLRGKVANSNSFAPLTIINLK